MLYLPKIQTAGEAALWNDMLSALEEHLKLSIGTIKVYVLVEQVEATYQLMEIRAALCSPFSSVPPIFRWRILFVPARRLQQLSSCWL